MSKMAKRHNNSPSALFPVNRLAWWIKCLAVTPLIWSAHTIAGVADGTTVTVTDNDQAYQQWNVRNGATFNVVNSDVGEVIATQSTVNLSGASIASNGEANGLNVQSSRLTVDNSVLNGAALGLQIVRQTAADPTGSNAQISNSQINGGTVGIVLSASDLLLSNSVVNASAASGIGLRLAKGTAQIVDSSITGGANGVVFARLPTVNDASLVDLDNSHVEGQTGAAVVVDNRGEMTSVLNVRNGSTLVGGDGVLVDVRGAAILAMNVSNSALVGDIVTTNPINATQGPTLGLALDGSSLTGNIEMQRGGTADLALANGSRMTGDLVLAEASTASFALSGGSQFIGDVGLGDASTATVVVADASRFAGDVRLAGASTATVDMSGGSWVGNVMANGASTVDLTMANASQMTGDVIADADSTARVTLGSGSQLTGRLEHLTTLAINDGAVWQMVEDSTVADLSLKGGTVKFGEGFQTLNVGELSGNGTFAMTADFASGESDLLNVTGNATGDHTLLIAASGNDLQEDASLHVVHIASGNANFDLLGGSVDLGTWSYGLRGDGSDWYLDASQKTISPGTASVLALFNTAPTVWYGELSSLRSRMGELRHNGGQSGAWSRVYGGKYNVSGDNGLSYSQQQNGFSLGADAPLPIGDGQWLVGVLAGHSDSDLSLARGSSGTVKSYYAGAYTTWLDAQSGYYFDGVLKFNRFDNDSKVNLSDGTRAKGSYSNNALGASAEFGRHIKLDDGYFVEPSAQLASVFIQGRNYSLDNGLDASGERTRSLLGKLGATAGKRFDLGEGRYAQPYLRAAYVHEFAKGNKVSVNDNSFNNDLSGSRGELGAGVSVAIADKWDVHADFQYTDGEKLSQPWGGNLGVRYSW